MDLVQILLIVCGVLGVVLLASIITLFFISRRSQRVMQSLLDIMLQPERTQVNDAVRVLENVLAGEVTKISELFNSIQATLNTQIAVANQLQEEMENKNSILVNTADEAVKKISLMSGRLENTVDGLSGVVESEKWHNVEQSTDIFSNTVNQLLDKVTETTTNTANRTDEIRNAIDGWVATADNLSGKLQSEFENNDTQMKTLSADYENMRDKMVELSDKTANGFETVKSAAGNYDSVMKEHNTNLDAHLAKMDAFFKQSKQQLTEQKNMLINTSNVTGGQLRLAETSLDNQIAKLTDVVNTVTTSAGAIATELTNLNNKFNKNIKEFSADVVKEISTVSGVANTTLENTKTAANAFSDSVRAMATGVRETLIEMNDAHTQLKGQSENLIKMSADTTAQLQPLSELIERYFAALPGLREDSIATNNELAKIVDGMNKQIEDMKQTVAESTASISQSAISLDDLAGQSRQQMIDLMSDYAQAVNTMQTLNKQMAIARATAPMDAMGATSHSSPAAGTAHVGASDFLAQAERMMVKIHDQSMDLTQTTGAEIPDVVWKKYHAGDNTIFSKWLARIMAQAEKRQVKEMLKSNTAFRNQAQQFVRSFDKIMDMVPQTDNPSTVTATLNKTDLGIIYGVLKPLM